MNNKKEEKQYTYKCIDGHEYAAQEEEEQANKSYWERMKINISNKDIKNIEEKDLNNMDNKDLSYQEENKSHRR